MATIRLCDCCGKKAPKARTLNTIQWLCHLTDMAQGKHSAGYVDNEGNAVSGRQDVAEVCIACYNKIMIESVKKYFTMRKENKPWEKLDGIE